MSSESLLTPSIISQRTLVILENNLVAAGRVNRQFENAFHKIGSTLTIRKPNRFTVSSGPALQIQNISEPSTSITITNQNHVDFQFSTQELTLVIEEFSERYLKPAAAALANIVDVTVLGLFNQFNNEVGTPGTVPAAYTAITAVGQRLDTLAAPQDNRTLILGQDAYWSIDAALTTGPGFQKSVAEAAYKGFLVNLANFDIFLDQNVQAQTVGAYGGTPVVNGANQTGSSLVTNGWSDSITGLLNVGDVFTLAGVYSVNPQSRLSTQKLMQFIATATANSDGSGNATIQINPPINPTGAYQNVTNSPANSATISVMGAASASYFQNIGFCKDAMGLVMVPMEIPNGVDFAAREMYKNIGLRIIRAYDISNDVIPTRVDILFGVAAYYYDLAVRLTN